MKIIIRGGEVLKLKGSKAKKAKSLVEGPNPRVPHLVLPPELGNEDRYANPWRRLGDHLSSPCWT